MTKNYECDFYKLIHHICNKSTDRDVSAVSLTENAMVILTEESNRMTGTTSGLPPHEYEATYRTLLPIAARYLREQFDSGLAERLNKDPEAMLKHLDALEEIADQKFRTFRQPPAA